MTRTTRSPYNCVRTGDGPNDFRLELIQGSRLTAIQTTDSAPAGGRRTRDDILRAVPVGRVLCLGTVYNGDLRPYVDGTVEALKPIVTGFSAGRVLHAETIGEVLDLGVALTGGLLGRIGDAADRTRRAGTRDGEPIDITELARAVERLQAAFNGGESTEILDAFERFKRSGDTLDRSRDADRLEGEREEARTTLQRMNEENAKAWRRDEVADCRTGDSLGRRPAKRGNTVSEINRANAEFWNQNSYGGNGPKDAA